MRILIATDGSDQSSASIISACRMLGPKNRLADLVCVTPKVPDHGKHPHRERLYRGAQHILDQTKAILAGEGVTTDPVLRTGSPARILVGASRNYDLTIIAASSNGSSSMLGLGAVASRVAEHAHGAVLLAREGNGSPGMRVLAAVDGSEGAISALQIMTELLELRDAEVTLLHVVETPWLHEDSDREWFGDEEEPKNNPQVLLDPQVQMEDVFKKQAEEILLTARYHLPAETNILTITREGLPADEILSETDNGHYDLVVLGVSGSLDMKHKMLGSVSSKVAWNAPCSVLLAGSAADRE